MIQKLAQQRGWRLDAGAVEAINRILPTNPRLLAGRIRQLLPQRPLLEQPMTVAELKLHLTGKGTGFEISVDQIINQVALRLQLSERLLRSQSRRKNVVLGRSIAIYLIRKLTNVSLKSIGTAFGNRDHATILHAIQKVEHSQPEDMQLSRLLDELQISLQGSSDPLPVDLGHNLVE
jgi:chromosomal replication initiator protein